MQVFRNNSCFPSVKIGIIPSKYGVKAGFIPSNHIAKRGIIPFGCFEWAIIRIAITMARQRRMWRNFSPQRFACRATVFYHMGARALSVHADCVVKNIIGLTRTIHAYLRGQMSAWRPQTTVWLLCSNHFSVIYLTRKCISNDCSYICKYRFRRASHLNSEPRRVFCFLRVLPFRAQEYRVLIIN